MGWVSPWASCSRRGAWGCLGTQAFFSPGGGAPKLALSSSRVHYRVPEAPCLVAGDVWVGLARLPLPSLRPWEAPRATFTSCAAETTELSGPGQALESVSPLCTGLTPGKPIHPGSAGDSRPLPPAGPHCPHPLIWDISVYLTVGLEASRSEPASPCGSSAGLPSVAAVASRKPKSV